jgi:hypothetical protein
MQPENHSSSKRLLLFLLIPILIVAALLLAVSLLEPNFNQENAVNPGSSFGSMSENVESIQIEQIPFFEVPEFSFGGTLTVFITLIVAFALFAARKKRSK